MDYKSKTRTALVTALGAVLLFAFIISAAVVVALHFRPLYYLDIKILHIAESSALPPETIRANYDALIDYNSLWNRGELNFPDFPMSEGGRIHFQEVKAIFDAFQLLFLFSLGGFLLLRWKAAALRDGRYARIAGAACFILTALIGVFVLLGWDKAFVLFHKLFFANDLWLFDYRTDPVITILPDSFFLHEALLILVLVLLFGSLALILGDRKIKQT